LTENDKLTTTEDAWKALIRQEEYTKDSYSLLQERFASGKTEDEFKKTLSADDLTKYEQQKKDINAVIDKRMEYVSKYMDKSTSAAEYQQLVSAMKSGV